ncbi:MAG TPA: sulfite exporter TauE/SafE family protein [Chloroflexota bacterium]|nr:sulfite exporter TauE/SafE family protein [Chloroflexota bacterium]
MEQIALALAGGVLVGLLLGLVGGGGSILTVPILVYALGESAHLATGTALAIVGANALIGAWEHGKASRVRLPVGLIFGGIGIVGALAGSWLNHLAPERAVLVGFALLMLAAATAMARVRLRGRQPAPEVHITWRVTLAGLGVGVLTGFFGVGGGFLIVPALVLVLGLPMRDAVGTSLVVIAINAAAALAGHLRYGGIDLEVTVLFIIGGAVGSVLGSRLSGRLDEERLRQSFAGLVVLVALYILARTVLGHPSGT